jgi:hypothetical protein
MMSEEMSQMLPFDRSIGHETFRGAAANYGEWMGELFFKGDLRVLAKVPKALAVIFAAY